MEHRSVYNRQAWRDLPRNYCAVHLLLGDAAGVCHGLIHHHHVDPLDPESRTIQVCQSHHPKVHALLRGLSVSTWKQCNHRHRYDHARRECEARLNQAA